MTEPRSAAEEARDPSTTPERLLELTEKHPQLQKLIVLNPSSPEVARQWILATNPWAKKAYEESTSSAGESPREDDHESGDESGDTAPDAGSSLAAQQDNDAQGDTPIGAPDETDEPDEPDEPDEVSVWGDFFEDDLEGDTSRDPERAARPATAGAGTASAGESGPVTVRVAEDRGVVPLGPVNPSDSPSTVSPSTTSPSPVGLAGAGAAGAGAAAAGASAAGASAAAGSPAAPASPPAPSPSTASAPPSARPDALSPEHGAAPWRSSAPQPQYPTEQTPTATYGLPAFSGPAAAQYGAAAPPSPTGPAGPAGPAGPEGPESSDPSRRRLWFVCGGCLLLALVLLIVGGFGARALLAGNDDEYQRDSTTTAEEAPSSSPEEAPTTTATPSKDPVSPAPDGAREMTELSSPSGNITCQLEKDTVACSIVDRSFSGAGLEDCSDGPFSMKVSKGTAVRDCGSSYLSDTAETLEYTESATHGNTACTSRSEGMTCWNTNTGHGFSVNRASYETF